MGASQSLAVSSATEEQLGMVGPFELRSSQRVGIQSLFEKILKRLLDSNNIYDLATVASSDKCKNLIVLISSTIEKEFTVARFPDPENPSKLQSTIFLPFASYERAASRSNDLARKRKAVCDDIAFFMLRFITLIAAITASMYNDPKKLRALIRPESEQPFESKLESIRIPQIEGGLREMPKTLFDELREYTKGNKFYFKDLKSLNEAKGIKKEFNDIERTLASIDETEADPMKREGRKAEEIKKYFSQKYFEKADYYYFDSQSGSSLDSEFILDVRRSILFRSRPDQRDTPVFDFEIIMTDMPAELRSATPAGYGSMQGYQSQPPTGYGSIPQGMQQAAYISQPGAAVAAAAQQPQLASGASGYSSMQSVMSGASGNPLARSVATGYGYGADGISVFGGQPQRMSGGARSTRRRRSAARGSAARGSAARGSTARGSAAGTRRHRGLRMIGGQLGKLYILRLILRDSPKRETFEYLLRRDGRVQRRPSPTGMNSRMPSFMSPSGGEFVPFSSEMSNLFGILGADSPKRKLIDPADSPASVLYGQYFDSFSAMASVFKTIPERMEKSLGAPAVYRAFLLATRYGVEEYGQKGAKQVFTFLCRNDWNDTKYYASTVPFALLQALYKNVKDASEQAAMELKADAEKFITEKVASGTADGFDTIKFKELPASLNEFCAKSDIYRDLPVSAAQGAILQKAHSDLRKEFDAHVEKTMVFLRRILKIEPTGAVNDAGFKEYDIHLESIFFKDARGSLAVLEDFIKEARKMLVDHYIRIEKIYTTAVLDVGNKFVSPKPAANSPKNS